MLLISLDSVNNFTFAEETKLRASVAVLERVINSDEFHRMLGDEIVYQHIMSGSETLKPDNDGVMNINITMYNKWWSKVIGYTYPWTPKTYINKKFFKRFNYAGIASNLAHEGLGHKMGYGEPWSYHISDIVFKLAGEVNIVDIKQTAHSEE